MTLGIGLILFAVAENYPQLKANENFLQLQGRISGIENEIADRREFYNDAVNTYNIRDHGGLDTALKPGDVVTILQAVSGG